MAAIDWATVILLAPELSTVAEDAQTLYLEIANAHFSADVMGGESSINLKFARVYYAAHLATVAGYASAGTAGPVTERQLGDERTKYGGATQAVDLSAADPLDGSAYGRLLKGLLKSTPLARLPQLL